MSEEMPVGRLREHDVLFLDFLGFASAIEHWPDERMEGVVDLLASLAAVVSSFDVKGAGLPDGGYKITTSPEITTFSDHIVVSYPRLTPVEGVPEEASAIVLQGWDHHVHGQMQQLTAQVAMAALEIGLLVRGGLSRGRLFHARRVVVGEAMVDAYRLESRDARNPRVLVSDRIPENDRFFRDSDGRLCLDYLGPMILLAQGKFGDAEKWARSKINPEIAALTGQGRTKDAAKWIYFSERLNQTFGS